MDGNHAGSGVQADDITVVLSWESIVAHVHQFVEAACDGALWNRLCEGRFQLLLLPAGSLVGEVLEVVVREDQGVSRAIRAERDAERVRLLCGEHGVG
jgi:hypothetical protein